MTDSSAEGKAQEVTPIIIDLGKTGRKKAKKLKKGKGPLVEQVNMAVQQVQEQLGDQVKDGVMPVVILFEKKPKKDKISKLFPMF